MHVYHRTNLILTGKFVANEEYLEKPLLRHSVKDEESSSLKKQGYQKSMKRQVHGQGEIRRISIKEANKQANQDFNNLITKIIIVKK